MSEQSMRERDLLEAFADHEPGCPVCKLLLRDAARHIDALLYEYSNKIPVRLAFRASRGFCTQHAWQMREVKGRALNVAVLYREVLEGLNRLDLGRASASPLDRLRGKSANPDLAARLEPEQPCAVCTIMNESEQTYLNILARNLQHTKFQERYRASGGMCLPHVRLAVARITSPADSNTLMTLQRAIWGSLQHEVEEFIRKNDINNAGEKMGAEHDSWQRAIRYMSGEPGVFGLRR